MPFTISVFNPAFQLTSFIPRNVLPFKFAINILNFTFLLTIIIIIAKLGAGIVSLPVNIDNLGDDIMREPASELAFDPKDFHKRVPNSIDLLSPSSPFLTTMQKVPMDMTIPYHSIVGVRKATTGPGSSDGVVPYESSHLDFAISEKLVPSGHWVQKHALSIAEVNRILKLHLRAANKEETMVFNLLNAPLLMP